MRNVLNNGQSLKKGESLQSENGQFTLNFQEDGNLVTYRIADRKVYFASGTNNKKVDSTFFQNDGNFVIYDGNNAVWAAGTNGKKGKYLKLENHGDLVIYDDSGNIIWSSINNLRDKWMSLLSDNLTLSQICIPGTHDAGMYETTNTQEGMALCQKFTLKEQLEHGVRYFDLRPRYHEGRGWPNSVSAGIHIAHDSAIGPHLTNVMEDIYNFIKTHQTETIILNFSHFQDFTNDNRDKDFINDIGRGLENHYLKVAYDTDIWSLPLKDLRGKAIILISRSEIFNPYKNAHPEGGIFYETGSQGRGDRIYDDYSNKQDYHEMLQDQKNKYNNFINNSTDKRLFLLNWTLTPDGTMAAIANFFTGGKVEKYAKDINPRLRSDFNSNLDLFRPSKPNKKVNIINLDYVNFVEWDVLPICKYITDINP